MPSVTAFPTGWSGNGNGTGVDWLNMQNIGTDDASDATIAVTAGSSLSRYLTATGFNFSAIPSNARVLGVTMTMRRKVDTAFGIQDDNVYLVVSNARVGTSKTAGFWDTSFQSQVFGGTSDLWGLSSLSINDVIYSSGFGVACRVSHFIGTPIGSVNYISMSIEYSVVMRVRKTIFV